MSATNESIVILQLTQDNLRRNSKEPKPDNLYHVGISYEVNKKHHVRFSDENSLKGIASNDFIPFQKLSMNLYFSKNKYFSDRKLDKYTLHRSPPKELVEIPSSIWEKEVIRALLKLIDDANIKQKTLVDLLKNNPHLPCESKYFNFAFCGGNAGLFYYKNFPIDEHKKPFVDYSPGVKDFFNSWLFWLIVVLPLLFLAACVGNTILCTGYILLLIYYMFRYFTLPKRGSSAEIEWIQSITIGNPELDFDKIEDDLVCGIEKIVKELNDVHLNDLPYRALPFFGQETVRIRDNNSYDYDSEEGRYVILFVNKYENGSIELTPNSAYNV